MIIYGYLHSAADPGGGLIGTGPKTIKIGMFLLPAHAPHSLFAFFSGGGDFFLGGGVVSFRW